LFHSSNDKEKILLDKVAAGDEHAFAELFENYHQLLGSFVMRLIKSESLTQEIVQDVFVKIWINRGVLAEITCFKAYLIVVARNHALNSLKQIARDRSRQTAWVNNVLRLAANDQNETDSTINTSELIDQAIALLPPQQKKVYLLSRREGLHQEEIAAALNISLETVKKHMVLALRFLKNHLRTHIGIFLFLLVRLFSY
jgi:RNA polymerase sigma-70 factor (family 1)